MHLLSWGSGPAQVGLQVGGHDALARGPTAVSVLPSGDPIVLDSLNQRVLRIEPEGNVESLAPAADDHEALAVDSDGAIALFSPLRSSALVLDAHANKLGEVSIPRELRDVVALSFGPSRRLIAHTAYQEQYRLGSVGARASLESVLQSKREGAAMLGSGQGVSVVRSQHGRLDLLVLSEDPSSGRTRIDRRLELASGASSGRIVGVARDTVCVRIERVGESQALSVARELVCLDAATGHQSLRAPLPAPGLYLPRAWIAMGGVSPRLAVLQPRDEGLAIHILEIGTGAEQEGAR